MKTEKNQKDESIIYITPENDETFYIRSDKGTIAIDTRHHIDITIYTLLDSKKMIAISSKKGDKIKITRF